MEARDVEFMKRALQLAAKGRGTVSPNPMVGCVIVHEGRIIGEGWHREYGKAHAEVNAVQSVEDQSLLKESTCYVTLEPCSHYGKTPPCADMLARHGLERVVVATLDSNPLVAGRGIDRMKSSGIEVEVGLMEKEARQLNTRFFTKMEKKRPYVLLKWAETADGFIARKNFDSKWISGETSRLLVHQWRAEEDAIMVGTNTALHDNPRLNVRGVEGNDPVRVVIDKELKLPKGLNLFDGSQPTLCYNLSTEEKADNLDLIKLEEADFLEALLADMAGRKINSVLVEGGSQLLHAFLDAGLWDEARVFSNGKSFGEGIAAPEIKLDPTASDQIEKDRLNIYYNPEPK